MTKPMHAKAAFFSRYFLLGLKEAGLCKSFSYIAKKLKLH
jgi:hypothetical protein